MVTTLNNAIISQTNLQLANTQSRISDALVRLSTGQRINQASQDAVALVMSTQLQTQVATLSVARYNAQDAISLLDTSSGALESAAEPLIRAEELTIRAGSAALSSSDRALIDAELQSIKTNLNELSDQTAASGRPLFGETNTFVLGTESTGLYSIETGEISAASLGIEDITLSSAEEAQAALGIIQGGLDTVLSQHAEVAGMQSIIRSKSDQIRTDIINYSKAYSHIADTDFARETESLSTSFIKQQASSLLLVHTQANLTSFLASIS